MKLESLARALAEAFGDGAEPSFALAPGRVNLIGEHTDYNDGFVLPMAIDRYVGTAFRPRADRRVRAFSVDFAETRKLDLNDLMPGRERGWSAYVAGVLWALREAGVHVPGLDLAIQGDVPIGAGLSSSAAIEMAVARAACHAGGIAWDPVRMALAGQQAERGYVGVSCGIMDQFASSLSRERCALLLDCRSFGTKTVPIPPEALVVVMDTGMRRTLAGSAYNERFAQCQAAVAAIRVAHPDVRALRDVTPEMLAACRGRLDPLIRRRAQHVVHENLRPNQVAEAFRAGDLARAGRLMLASHESLRDLYEVSCEELDAMVQLASEHPACFGARLTGAGFGGCAVALVRRSGIEEFLFEVRTGYASRSPHPFSLYPCEPSRGAHLPDGAGLATVTGR